jgi:hypothetical protein
MGEQFAARVHPKRVIKPGLNILFPEVDGLREKRIEKEINRSVAKKMHRMIAELGYDPESGREIWGGYQVKLNDYGILSLRLEHFSQIVSGSRSRLVVKPLNFDLKTGELFKFEDLFREDTDYASRLNELIKSEIVVKGLSLSTEFFGIFKRQSYYLTETSLVIVFQPGEYTPESGEGLEVEIAYETLADLVYKNGPIARLLERKVLIS